MVNSNVAKSIDFANYIEALVSKFSGMSENVISECWTHVEVGTMCER